MFRGRIKANSSVTSTFSPDSSNEGTAAMVTTYGPATGAPTTKTVVVSPGMSDSTKMALKGKGLYRIVVDVKNDRDGGVLKVEVDGQPRDGSPIKADTTWLYSVE